MKGFFISLNLTLAALFLTTAVLADDVDDIKALEMDARVQESAGNVDGYFQYKGSGYTIPPPYQRTSLSGVDQGAGPGKIRRGHEVQHANAEFRRQVLRRHGPLHLLPGGDRSGTQQRYTRKVEPEDDERVGQAIRSMEDRSPPRVPSDLALARISRALRYEAVYKEGITR